MMWKNSGPGGTSRRAAFRPLEGRGETGRKNCAVNCSALKRRERRAPDHPQSVPPSGWAGEPFAATARWRDRRPWPPLLTLGLALLLLAGCASPTRPANPRSFAFEQDTFAYANDLVWEYYFDAEGKWQHRRREPPRDYTHHCFVVARSARQFFEHATFDPSQPAASEKTYRKLIRKVVSLDPSRDVEDHRKVTIPGYPNLREFSKRQEKLLQEECGGAWQSYFQRGHWRMIFPVSEQREEHEVDRWLESLKLNHPPVVHLFTFPQLTINHALLIYGADTRQDEVHFQVYDPNKPEQPGLLTFDRQKKTFCFPGNDYFIGGKVNVYEVYRSTFY